MLKVEVMEITEEEKNIVLKKRKDDARKAEMSECFAQVQELLARIEQLGGTVCLPSIGGKYVCHHSPIVRSTEVKLWRQNKGGAFERSFLTFPKIFGKIYIENKGERRK